MRRALRTLDRGCNDQADAALSKFFEVNVVETATRPATSRDQSGAAYGAVLREAKNQARIDSVYGSFRARRVDRQHEKGRRIKHEIFGSFTA